ncbi:restriction endonuclease subunit S, partial [uncultured Streptococcus sp.]|uniref:restriction endonuclease subunit S n=1 Tax=uncultured Streptococcus sp. TaxID=83427 RepID=UPI002610C8E1
MMTKKSPQLRFEGFTDDWEQRKLGELTTSFSGGTPSAGNSSYYKGDIPFIRSGEINSDKTELFLTEAGLKNSSAKMVSVGDILYALYGATSGEVGISQINGAINQAILAIKPCDGYNSHFLMQWLKLQKQKIIDKYLQGGQGNLSGSIVKNLVLNVPSYEEQQKIGSFFKQLDETIDLHQRKLDLLKEQKKGFLQKMFPKNGEKVPELRFAGFADDWEERKLGELALVLTGFPFKNEDFVDNGKYLVITNGNIQNESSTVDVSLGNRVDDLSDEIKERYYLNKNDILVTMDGTVGRTAKVVDDNLILAQRVARLVANKNTEFVYQWLNQGSFFNEMTKVSHGGTIKHISLNEISNYSATVPSNNIEQQKIGSFFKQLDDTIALHQRKLDLLKEQKKG